MKRKCVLRDQGWLSEKRNKHGFDKKILKSQFDYDNRWLKPGMATIDLRKAFESVTQGAISSFDDHKSLILAMSIWLRENRRLVPSPATFRRFLLDNTIA